MELTRIGVIGSGYMGLNHIQDYLHHKDCLLTAIVDTNILRLSQLNQNFHVPCFLDYSAILPLVDAVTIATPTSTHYEIAKFFIESRKHVLLEKPIASTTWEAEQLVKLAHKNGVVLAVGHIERFNPVTRELRKLLRREAPLFIDIHREGTFDSRVYDCDVVSDLMIHDLDLLSYLLNVQISFVSAFGTSVHSIKKDIVNAQLQSRDGTLINLVASRSSHSKRREWKLIFRNMTIEANLLQKTIAVVSNSETKPLQIDQTNALRDEQADFISAIQDGVQPMCDGVCGHNVLQLVEEIQRGVKTFQFV